MVKARQLFVHQIATLGRYRVLPFLIYAYSSLSAVAYYTNYTLIVDKLNAILNNVLNSTGAGVGNMIAEGKSDKIMDVYWQLTSLRYFLSGILVFGIYHLIEPFISIWLGSEYIMSKPVLILILINMFIVQVRGTNDQFIYGYGLFSDTWAPIVTFILTIGTAILCGMKWGLAGVLAGDAVSGFFIIYMWKPFYLFSGGFKVSVWRYWKEIIKYLILLFITWIGTEWILDKITINPYIGYWGWILYACVLITIFTVAYGLITYIFCNGFRRIIYRLLRHKRERNM